MFTLRICTLSNKTSISLSVQLKVGSSFSKTWLFLIVFVFSKVDAMFLKFYTVPTTCGQFVPQYFACCVNRSLQSKNAPERYLYTKCEHGLMLLDIGHVGIYRFHLLNFGYLFNESERSYPYKGVHWKMIYCQNIQPSLLSRECDWFCYSMT